MMIRMRDKAERPEGVTRPAMTCEEFQAQMPELMGREIHDHEHLKTCARCGSLIEDLEYIARIAGDLMQPVYEPRADVWERITASLPQSGNGPANGQVTRPTGRT